VSKKILSQREYLMLTYGPRIPVVNRSTEVNGYSTATSAWLVLSDHGADIGGTRKGSLSEEDEDGIINPPCDESRHFDSLEDLENASGEFPTYCARLYALQVLQTITDDAMNQFHRDNSKDYDHLFKSYEKAFRPSVADELKIFMRSPDGKGRKYFYCKMDQPKREGKCDTVKEPKLDGFTLTMSITDEDKVDFFKELLTETGIQDDWVEFGNEEEDGYEVFAANG
jgi:hypothetical protein